MNKYIDEPENTIHLQGIGVWPAIPSSEVQVGDFLMWNYGGISEIIALISETKCFLEFSTYCNGAIYRRKLKKDRLVCRVSRDTAITMMKRNHQPIGFFEAQ